MKKLFLIFALFISIFAQASIYNAAAPPTLAPGIVINVWNAETPTPGNNTTAASQQIVLFCTANGNACPFGVDGKFSGAPGAFEVDVQVAATDSDTNYQTCSNCNITTVDATNNTFHLDFTGVARFVRLLMRSRTNSVSVTATFTGG
jgi:hypothetical protein